MLHAKLSHTRHTDKSAFHQKLVEAVNNLVEKDELVAWSRMEEEQRERTITKLLHTVEESALYLANNYKTPAELQIKATEMGEIIINAERSHRHSNYIKLSCHSLPPVCSEFSDNCHFNTFTFFISILFFSSTTELKLFTFDALHIKAKLSASMGGDHIQLTPKLRPEEDRNGKVADFTCLMEGHKYHYLRLGCTASSYYLCDFVADAFRCTC